MSEVETKSDMFKWAEAQTGLDTCIKYLLEKLVLYANGAGDTWSTINILSKHINKSERTVQNYMRQLERAGLIKLTGRTYRLPKSTRSVPLYSLQFDVIVAAESVGGEGGGDAWVQHVAPIDPSVSVQPVAPIDGVWVQNSASMGADCCTRKETIETTKGAIAPSAGAREALRAGFEALEEVTPRRVFGVSDRDVAFEVYVELAAEGVDVSALPGCMGRMAIDPIFTGRRIPPKLEDWLRKGQYRAWLPGDPAADAPANAPTGWAGPADIRAAIVAARGETFAVSYLDPARWDGEAIVPRTSAAASALAELIRKGQLKATLNTEQFQSAGGR
ncbi:MAG: helix-turn-helix domain-containing protein [Caulobacteraceae bacterium]|nr:helix-turn-helix domain-containing protein [Caulobacteraceae bacterium]